MHVLSLRVSKENCYKKCMQVDNLHIGPVCIQYSHVKEHTNQSAHDGKPLHNVKELIMTDEDYR